ncbi:MAG: MarR family winged helix-turn-helix transcriptional regulator [Pseudomonadota bacterium]
MTHEHMRRPADQVLGLEDSALVLLVWLGNKLTASGSATYRRHFGISITEFRIIALLAEEPDITGQRFCEVIGIDPGAASRALNALKARKLVANRADDANPAYRRWSLTSEGTALFDRTLPFARERSRILLEGIAEDQRAVLLDLLHRMLGRTDALFALADPDGLSEGGG